MSSTEKFDIDKCPMVRVTWLDARDTETGWMDIKKVLDAPLARCQEVGWLVTSNLDKIVIMRSFAVDPDDKNDINGGGAIAIPRTWIVQIEYLKVNYEQAGDKRSES
tara:strand:+ start:207 stop:527 length:321 start_codon:yes stop_codon:yes gene_type:complete